MAFEPHLPYLPSQAPFDQHRFDPYSFDPYSFDPYSFDQHSKESTEMHVPQRIRPQVPFIGSSHDSHDSHDGQEGDVVRGNSKVIVEAVAPVPTEHGTFLMYVFRWEGDDHEHVAMVRGDVAGREAVAVRVHSECMTSEVFHSLKCDCREQLHAALAEVARREEGVVLYLRQEGRGIGLANKIRAYALQANGADTVDANRMLGLPDDARRYDMAALMLEHLGVKSVRLMTNNPSKVDELRRLGVDVLDRMPHIIKPNQHSAGYLEAKRLRMHHALPSRPVISQAPATSSCSVPIETLDAE